MEKKHHELPAKKVIKSGPNSSGFFPSPKRTEPWHPKWSNHIFWGFCSFQTPKLPTQTLNILSLQKHRVLQDSGCDIASHKHHKQAGRGYCYTSSSSSFLLGYFRGLVSFFLSVPGEGEIHLRFPTRAGFHFRRHRGGGEHTFHDLLGTWCWGLLIWTWLYWCRDKKNLTNGLPTWHCPLFSYHSL